MKNKIYLRIVGLLAFVFLFSCDPYMDDNPDAGLVLPPDASAMDFSITPGDDDYHYNIELKSPELSGISKVVFDLGNGSVVKEKSATGYYPLPGDYTIKMTVMTNGGSSSITKMHTTAKTDYSIFTDEKYVMLTGGVENTEGKTWVLDAEATGHLGVGPAAGDPLEWWSAGAFAKAGTGAYDDELTFVLNGFKVTYDNKGVSYVKAYVKDDAKFSDIYLNPRENDTDFDVDYETPVHGTWSISEKDDGFYLILNGDKPIFPGLDVGALNNEYKIVAVTENSLELTCFSAYEDWTKWHFLLKPKGYERPKIELEAVISETGEPNAYSAGINVTNLPAGQSIDKFVVDFGDGTVLETFDLSQTLSNTYMRKGSYLIKVTAVTSIGEIVNSQSVDIAAHHPDYVPFLLNEMVMYNDFSEVIFVPVNGESCDVFVDDNPSKTYPNKSSKVAFYSKSGQQWANAFMQLPSGYRFDLRQISTFKIMVYGKAGDAVLLKLENTDWGGNAWMSGVELTYTIQNDNTWEVAEYAFEGVANNGSAGDVYTDDVTNPSSAVSKDFYNVIRIMLNPGNGDGTHEFYFDELSGPHVEGIKSAKIK